MKNLLLLQLNYVTFSGECNSLPRKLRLLRWYGFPLKFIPRDIPLKMVVVLDMSYSKLNCVWDDLKFIGSLKILNLSYCDDLLKTPDFSGLSGLESLILRGCRRLRKVDESIAYLKGLILLDITDCINLRELPCLPASLVSLEMSGCPNLGVVGGFRSLDSTSLPSFLVDLNISKCNLFDNSFPNDWSNLVSLKILTIDGNNITCLPKCIQGLPTLLHLNVKYCSQIQSIEGLPETLNKLYIYLNRSLEKVQLPQKGNVYIYMSGCEKLGEVEGIYKYQSIDKVVKTIIEKLRLGSSMEVNTLDYSKQKVLYEHGIFSTWVTRNQYHSCSSRYKYKEKGPQISFKVPEDDSRVITSFNLCLVFYQLNYHLLQIQVYNKTKDLLWAYALGDSESIEKVGWVSLWRCGINLLDDGDEIFVRIFDRDTGEADMEVEECSINLIYQEDNNEQHDDEEANNDGIAWSERMFTEISNFVHKGMTYEFREQRRMCAHTVIYHSQLSYDYEGQKHELVGWIED